MMSMWIIMCRLTFNGFKTLVDAVGGITVESEKAFRTSEGGLLYQSGNQSVKWYGGAFLRAGEKILLQMGIIPEDVIRCRQLRH